MVEGEESLFAPFTVSIYVSSTGDARPSSKVKPNNNVSHALYAPETRRRPSHIILSRLAGLIAPSGCCG